MVCIGGFIFGCKRPHSAAGYFLSALVVISIVVGLRILCYIIYRLLKPDQQSPDDHHHHSTSHDGVEMQAHRFCLTRASPDTKFVALGGDAGDGDSSFLVLHSQFQGTHL